MKSIIKKMGLTLITAIWVSFPSTSALADDTEVYVGGNSGVSTVRPNVLFIIDTSGSMGTSVTLTTGTYDPNGTYPTVGSCRTDRIYWSTSGTPPSCGTSRYIDAAANKCNDSSSQLAEFGTGYYVGRLARYRPGSGWRRSSSDYWSTLSSRNHTNSVECEADTPNAPGDTGYGDGLDTTKPYPANENNGGPWRSDSTGAVSWPSTGTNYTLYSGKYMNWYWGAGNTTTTTRLQIVKDTFDSLINSTSGINAGLMRFDSGGSGGYFLQPMQELTPANRATLITTANGLNASGVTPLSETEYESYLYWTSGSVDYGDSSSPGTNHTGVLDSGNTSKYKTPMEFQCQKNFSVILTDGQPVSDTGADSKIAGVTGSSCSGNCLDEMAEYMYEKDLNAMNDKQNVITYTIGFHTDQVLLSDTARKGGGEYHTAESATELSTAFTSILTDILAVNTTFVAPAVTVNAFNRLTHRDELYFAVFRPTGSPEWPGNVKHYKLGGDNNILIDANSAPAVDANTGFFSASARSFWTLDADAPDGEIVDKGGAASLLTTTRNLYTYTGAAAPANVDLTLDAHKLHEDNADLTGTLLGDVAMTVPYRTDLLKWSRGVDVLDEDEDGLIDDSRRAIGDPLHSKPVLVTYGGDDANPDITLYSGTNGGFVHGINTSDGSEKFAFMPKELLVNLDTTFTNSSTVPHPYGMDGPISVWHKDANNNGVVMSDASTIEADEHVYLYAGMRRGGNHYYALDVTNRDAPKLLWQIDGGTGDFAELGQTWSRPVVTKIKLSDGSALVERDVLIFAGGYDTDQDNAILPADDDIGRAIYIVDAATGQRLWWASSDATADLVLTEMTNSIPSDVTVIDIDTDGIADRMYVGDMGARVWRIDLDNDANTGAADLATGGLLASLGGADEADNRRFYYPPDVALLYDKKSTSQGLKLTVSIGSGYRSHPLNDKTEDRFYMIKDSDVYALPADGADADALPDYTAYTESDLYDATANVLGEATGTDLIAAETIFNDSQGWYIRLVTPAGTLEGEKVLASSVTVDNKILFTTFTPVAAISSNSCAPSQGTARAYVVNLTDATPSLDLNDDGTIGAADRSNPLTRGGIPPEPTVLFPPDGSDGVVLIGPEKLDGLDINVSYVKSYWRQDE